MEVISLPPPLEHVAHIFDFHGYHKRGLICLASELNLDHVSSRVPSLPHLRHFSLSVHRDGYNAWRDAFRPSQILAGLCQRCGLPGPEYRAGAVKVGSKVFLTPPETLPPGTSPPLQDNPQGANWLSKVQGAPGARSSVSPKEPASFHQQRR